MTDPEPRPYVPSGLLMSHVVDPITLRLGGPTLTVAGRRSGRPISTPVPPFEYEGAREPFRAVEVARSFFTAVPDPEDHAVFRFDPVAPAGQGED